MVDLTPYALAEYDGHQSTVALQSLISRVNHQLQPHRIMIRKKGTRTSRGKGWNNLQNAGNYYLWDVFNRELIGADVDPVAIARQLRIPGAFAPTVTRGLFPRLPATPSTGRDKYDDLPELLG